MQHRYENLTPNATTLTLYYTRFEEHVDIIGNYDAVIIHHCDFPNGLRILGKENFRAKLVRISTCNTSPQDWYLYPLKINNAGHIHITNTVCIGNGKPYDAEEDLGTADLFSINNSTEVTIDNCIAIDGGENGYSINGCRTVSIKDSIAMGNDGQGFHIGRHENPVEYAQLINIQAINNWRNQKNSVGKGCGVLLHNIEEVAVRMLYSTGHDYSISYMNRDREGKLICDGHSGDKKQIITNKTTIVLGRLQPLPLSGNTSS